MPRVKLPHLAVPLALLLLAACGGKDVGDKAAEQDPVVADAVNDPIMADPDLAAQNRGNAALTGGGPASAPIPPFNPSPEEIERARTAAADLLGGAVNPAPPPQRSTDKSRLAGAETPLAVAAALQMASSDCARSFAFSAAWAAKLPSALPVYPRGHTMVAGGSDAPQCKLRSVRFVTPVAASEVADFYYGSAGKAGLAPQHAREGAVEVVTGGRGMQKFAVYARKRADGLTEVDLVTAGF